MNSRELAAALSHKLRGEWLAVERLSWGDLVRQWPSVSRRQARRALLRLKREEALVDYDRRAHIWRVRLSAPEDAAGVSRCRRCSRPLRDAKSRAQGFGRRCLRRARDVGPSIIGQVELNL